MTARTDKRAREIAREEIASLVGLVFRRLGELDPGSVDKHDLTGIWAEALADFGGRSDDGQAPGKKP